MTVLVSEQQELFGPPDLPALIAEYLRDLCRSRRQPSAVELVAEVERVFGIEARWHLSEVVQALVASGSLTGMEEDYMDGLLGDDDLVRALRGKVRDRPDIASTIDELLQKSQVYRSSGTFREMLRFMARFRDYAPYNNMLVRLQNPTCSFFATAKDWKRRFNRDLVEDARPMLILAPMHPVMLVYDLDQTMGPDLPEELRQLGHFVGSWNPTWMQRTIDNAARDRIRVDFKQLSSTNAGFATFARETGRWKMRIAIHDTLDPPSRFGVLCHELAHIYLGHLGGDEDGWWPGRASLAHAAVEIEAEAVAFTVTNRLGLKGSSAEYVSSYLQAGGPPKGVSLDSIAKVAGHIERMATETLPPRRPRLTTNRTARRRPGR